MRKILFCLVGIFLFGGVEKVMAAPMLACYSQDDCGNGAQCVYLNDGSEKGYCAKIYQRSTPTPPPSCKDLWYFDNLSKNCAQKKFCGTYTYQGLQTFATLAECKNNLPKVNCAMKKCGDVNCDGRINFLDLVVWRDESGGKVNGKSSDFNGDGKVDTRDYDILRMGMVNGCKKVVPSPMIQRPVSPTPVAVRICNYSMSPAKLCPDNFKCVVSSKYSGADGICVPVSELTPTPKEPLVTVVAKMTCNMTTNPRRNCPVGFQCINMKNEDGVLMPGADGICQKIEQKPTISKKCVIGGDADKDGRVTLKDYGIWKTEYMNNKTSRGDFDCNGTVNSADFGVWKKLFLESKSLNVDLGN